ncbi:MAG: DUF4298 domain-containing protein [Neisseria sp.]|nr:DUF4298 domain-containing protein [Neisseria sp.]
MGWTKEEAQQRVDEIQAVYREWLDLQPRLAEAERDWQKSADLMKRLEDFYFGKDGGNGDFMRIYEDFNEGADLDWTTEGEYSVLSQDTVWNAVHEQHNQAWRRLRSALAVLDKEQGK